MQNKLIHTDARIIVRVDMNSKNSHTFEDGTKITLERKYDNFNMRYVNPVNATVISAEYIPEGAEVIIHHNCIHDTNKIFDYQPLSGTEIASDVRYFSILESEAFAWYDKESKSWKPLDGFDFALRVFKPYTGAIQGIEPDLIKNTLYMTTGIYKGQVCLTLKATDYELIFQDTTGREGRLIRVRTEGDEKTQREPEIVALDHKKTKQVQDGELLVGLSKSDAKSLKQMQYA